MKNNKYPFYKYLCIALLIVSSVSCVSTKEDLIIQKECSEQLKIFQNGNKELISSMFTSKEFNTSLFCKGYEEASKKDIKLIYIIGDPLNTPPCTYCGELEVFDEIMFTGDRLSDKRISKEYILGFNHFMYKEYGRDLVKNYCIDSSYYGKSELKDSLSKFIHVDWFSDSLILNVEKNKLAEKLKDSPVTIYTSETDSIVFNFTQLLNTFRVDVQNINSIGVEINLTKFEDERFCKYFSPEMNTILFNFYRQN